MVEQNYLLDSLVGAFTLSKVLGILKRYTCGC